MKLQEKLQLIKNIAEQLQQMQDKIYNLLEPFDEINTDIYDRKKMLDILMKDNYHWVEIRIIGSEDWTTGEKSVLGSIDLNEQEIDALRQNLENTIDIKLKEIDFNQITEFYDDLIQLNKIEK